MLVILVNEKWRHSPLAWLSLTDLAGRATIMVERLLSAPCYRSRVGEDGKVEAMASRPSKQVSDSEKHWERVVAANVLVKSELLSRPFL